MEILSEQQILDHIRKRQPFSARTLSGGFEMPIRIGRFLAEVASLARPAGQPYMV